MAPVLGASKRMPIQSQLSQRKKIGAPGPLNDLDFANRKSDGEPMIMTVLNASLLVSYVTLLILSAVFFGQARNVDSANNIAALGVRQDGGINAADLSVDRGGTVAASGTESVLHEGKGDGLLTMRDGETHQCDAKRVNAQWFKEQRDHFLRLRCVPSHLVGNIDASDNLFSTDGWADLPKLMYTPVEAAADAAAQAATVAVESTDITPLDSCAGDLTCAPGYTCQLIHTKPRICNPKNAAHKRCVCSSMSTAATIFLGAPGAVGEAKAGAMLNNLCWSSTATDNLRDGLPVDSASRAAIAAVTTAGSEDLGVKKPSTGAVLTGADAEGMCTAGTGAKCIVDDGLGYGGHLSTTWANTLALAPAAATSRRLSRTHSKRVNTRRHKVDPQGAYKDGGVDDSLRITNGQRLHELLYGRSTSSMVEEGQGGPAFLLIIFTSLSVLIGGGTWVADFFFAGAAKTFTRGRKDAVQPAEGGVASDSGYSIFYSGSQTMKYTGVALTVLTNLLDFATDICVLVLLQRARFNNDIDYPYGVSAAWSAAGCYDGTGQSMANDATGHLKLLDGEDSIRAAGDLAGDANLAWGLFIVVCVRFFVYRVLGTSLYTGRLDI